MLWINRQVIPGYDGCGHVEFDVHITRGDSGYIELIPKQDGAVYELGENDEVALQVRAKPIKSDAQTELVFSGEIVVSDGVPVWHITVENTTRNCGEFFWDVQLTSGSDVSTFARGRLIIEEEVTV